jgi:protein-S-isoprenylcysteine O-methyltransferase
LLSWIGLVLFAGGITFQTAAMLALHGMYTLRLGVQPAHRLVTSGPYRVVRHPGYLGNITEMLGIGLALSSLIVLVSAILVIPLLLRRIKDEEKMLIQEFPEYKTYSQGTKRLVPFIW